MSKSALSHARLVVTRLRAANDGDNREEKLSALYTV